MDIRICEEAVPALGYDVLRLTKIQMVLFNRRMWGAFRAITWLWDRVSAPYE